MAINTYWQVMSAGINPSDAKLVLGSFKHEGIILPRTPGRDFAGVVCKCY